LLFVQLIAHGPGHVSPSHANECNGKAPAGSAQPAPLTREMRELMTANVGIQRTEASLLHAEQELARLTKEAPGAAWRTHNQLLVATLITQAARRRRESRGGHRRLDYPPAAFRRETA
jgi:aspartate oxidase